MAEITLDGVTIGLQLKESGVMVKHLMNEGQMGDVGTDLALVVDSDESYMEYLDELRVATEEAEDLKEIAANREMVEKRTSAVIILRHIKHMIQNGRLKDETGMYVYACASLDILLRLIFVYSQSFYQSYYPSPVMGTSG